jgi:uncharacterized membrane protein
MTWLWSSSEVTARALRSMVALGVLFAAVTLTLGTVVLDLAPGNLASNLILSEPRHRLILLTFLAFGGAVGVAVLMLATRREAGLEALDWWARVGSPVVLLPFVVALVHRGFGNDVEVAVTLGVLVIVFERLMRLSLGAWAERPGVLAAPIVERMARVPRTFFESERAVVAVLVVATAAHGVLMSVWAVWSHQRFNTYGFDLGQYHQLFETTLHGRFLAAPAMGHPEVWGDLNCSHSDFIIFPLLPLYALHPTASMVLVLQALLIALGAIPTYLFARHFVSRAWALVLGLAWLAYPPMHGGQLYDFHTQPIGAAFAIWAMWALAARRNVAYWVFFALAISAREDVSMGLAMVGVFLVLTGQRVRLGLVTAAVSTVYFVVLRFVVMTSTAFAGSYADVAAFGENGFGAILQTLVSNPAFAFRTFINVEKVRYFFQIFAPVAFLPVRRVAFWLLLVAAFMLTLLTTAAPPMVSMAFQYVFNWVPYIFPLSAVALSLYGTSAQGLVKGRAALLALMLGTVLANLQWGAYSSMWTTMGGFVPVPLRPPDQSDLLREEAVQHLMAKVPSTASVCTSDRLQSHTTNHLDNWSLKTGLHDCMYLLWSDLGDFGIENATSGLAEGRYELVATEHGVNLAKKKESP